MIASTRAFLGASLGALVAAALLPPGIIVGIPGAQGLAVLSSGCQAAAALIFAWLIGGLLLNTPAHGR